MKCFVAVLALLCAQIAHAYEYKLQYTPPAGAHISVVAGYHITGKTVVGDCSYYTVRTGSGRGARSFVTLYYNNCTWDLYGNLISMVPEPKAPVTPAILVRSGYEIVYAISGASRAGLDIRGFGFVTTPSPHYSWETPSGGIVDISDAKYVMTATLVSDGDSPLVVDKALVEVAVSGLQTPSAGTAAVNATNCERSMPYGSTCSVTVTYTPTSIVCTDSPYGYAYTNLTLSLVTDAEANPDFKRSFTVYGVRVCGN